MGGVGRVGLAAGAVVAGLAGEAGDPVAVRVRAAVPDGGRLGAVVEEERQGGGHDGLAGVKAVESSAADVVETDASAEAARAGSAEQDRLRTRRGDPQDDRPAQEAKEIHSSTGQSAG